MPLGPVAQYLCKYNGYVLPGYIQSEQIESNLTVASRQAPYIDGSLSEVIGMPDKTIQLTLKVWENTYLDAKNQVEAAASVLRSSRAYAPLYLQYSDRHYNAIPTTIKVAKQAGTSIRILEYDVEFICQPYLISDTLKSISGTGTITTDTVSRTIYNGGWSPTVITISGTNPSVSAVTETGQSAGGFTVTGGAVSNLVIDSGAMTATINGVNANSRISNVNYQTFVGTGKTTFTITNATSCVISWYDRWPL